MIFDYVSKDVKVTPSMKKAVEEKLSKFDSYFRDEVKCVVRISIYSNRQKAVEATLSDSNFQLRAKTMNEDFYNAVDEIVEKLDGQLRKVKTQLKKLNKQKSLAENILMEQIEDEEDISSIVKRKTLTLAPMDATEALARMDALGHKFFIYLNSSTGKVNVLYERDDGLYGNIELEY